MLILATFEYVIRPIEKTLDEPLTDVKVLESRPPVQDSAKEITFFFDFNKLINFFTFFMSIKILYKV